jgi:hypothetical protein
MVHLFRLDVIMNRWDFHSFIVIFFLLLSFSIVIIFFPSYSYIIQGCIHYVLMNDERKRKNLVETHKLKKKIFLYRNKNLVFAAVQDKKIMSWGSFFFDKKWRRRRRISTRHTRKHARIANSIEKCACKEC